MKKFILKTPLLILFAMTGILNSACNNEAETVKAKEIIAQKNVLLIDVREYGEFSEGHVKNAKNISYQIIQDEIEKIAPDKNTEIALYCRSGRRSGIAKDKLEKMGYTRVINLGAYKDLKDSDVQ